MVGNPIIATSASTSYQCVDMDRHWLTLFDKEIAEFALIIWQMTVMKYWEVTDTPLGLIITIKN